MSKSDPQKDFEFKDSAPIFPSFSDDNSKNQVNKGFSEEEKSKDQSMEFCPPKNDLNAFLTDYQMKKGESAEENEECLSEKFSGPLEKPKTANKAFGSISDFLLFFENRNHEIKGFAKRFQEMEDLTKTNISLSLKVLNEEIAPRLSKSLKKMPVEFKNHESKNVSAPEENKEKDEAIQKIKKGFGPAIQKMKMQKEQNKEYFELFEKDFGGLEEFYKQILHAYTINGVLYRRMNEYLRTEDWIKLDELLIYTYCLFKTYLWGPTGLKDADSFACLKSRTENNKLTLYRRADFDQLSLDFYRLDKTKEFSWSAVTSTSLVERATRRFAGNNPTKKPVLIMIEVDFQDLQPENFNALYLAKLSKYPLEEEVALAPGSIFELLDINKRKPEVEMRLKLVTNPKILARQGKFLHGMLQAVMRQVNELKIVCLKEKELSRAIKHCKGNILITKLEFSLCNFNKWSAELLVDVLPTLENLKSFSFNSVVFESDYRLDKVVECLGKKGLTELEVIDTLRDDDNLQSLIGGLGSFGSFKNFKLSFQENYPINKQLMREFSNQVHQYLDHKCAFEFNMTNDLNIIGKGLNANNFLSHIGNEFRRKLSIESQDTSQKINVVNLIGAKRQFGYHLIGENNENIIKRTLRELLEDKHILSHSQELFTEEQFLAILSLSFEGCRHMSDQDIRSLGCEDIHHFQSLIHLDLDFYGCHAITDKALQILSQRSLQKLTRLRSLNLCFDNCVSITDEGLKSLICGIQHLPFLISLKVIFNGCKAITNQGLKHFSSLSEEIKSLNLSFEHCLEITDEGFENFIGPENLHFLVDLSLNFSYCSAITDKALQILSQKALQNLKTSLKTLTLEFDGCNEITDEGLIILTCEGITHLELLQNLSLSFENSDAWNLKITDKGIDILRKYINNSSLRILHLNFDGCREITDRALRDLSYPYQLIHLHLSFNECNKIDHVVFIFQGLSLKQLRLLESLHLSFRNSEPISDKGLEVLCSQGIKRLQKLNKLHLDLSTNRNGAGITDQGLKSLGFDGIRHLPELKILYLDLDGHHNITHLGLRDFCHDLKNKLADFSLSIHGVTDQGAEAFNFQGVSLETLNLKFNKCPELSDEGLKKFWKQGIRHLNKLKNLHLQFDQCQKITDEGLKGLCDQGIRHLTSLVTLNINFANCKNITEGQILSLQCQINLLNPLSLQLPLEIHLEKNNMRISSQYCRQTASVLCQDRLEFSSNTVESQLKLAENLTIKFEEGQDLTDLDFSKSIFNLQDFKSLITLHLAFDGCVKITDFTLHNLRYQGIQHLKFLISLSLSFSGCDQITDRGLKILAYSIGNKHFKASLIQLSLIFDGCKRITNKGITKLYDHCLRPLESLKLLCLSFRFCNRITNKGVKRLYHRGIKSFASFFIDFTDVKITERLKRQLSQSSSTSYILISQNLISTIRQSRLQRPNAEKVQDFLEKKSKGEIVQNTMFTRYVGRKHYELQTHDDQEYGSHQIKTDKDLFKIPKKDIMALLFLSCSTKSLKKSINQELAYLSSLTSLYLTLDKWKKYVTDSALNNLCLEVFPHFKSLNILRLNFSQCNGITDLGLNHLALQGMRHLRPTLATLHLNFGECRKITDVGLTSLWNDGILYLELLTTLDLSFEQCSKITGDYLKNSTKGVFHLTSLALNFESCQDFKDENFKTLCLEVLPNLAKLHILHLNFNKCCQITDSGFDYFNPQKKSFSTLSLSFDQCWHMTEKGLQNICLSDTKALHLNLSHCPNITLDLKFFNSLKILHLKFQGSFVVVRDQALKGLCETGFRNLVSLDVLGLCFDSCYKITDAGIHTLCCDGLQFMKELTTLYLSFSQCSSLTEKSLKSLCHDGIEHLDSLTNLHLCFSECPKITYTMLSSLGDRINLLPLPHLQQPLEIGDSKQIFSPTDPSLSKTSPLKVDPPVLQKFRNQKIMQAMAWESKNIDHLSFLQSDDLENLEKSEATSILFDYFQNITNPLTSPLFSGLHWPAEFLEKFNFNFEIIGEIADDNFENLSPEEAPNSVELMKLRLNFKGQMMTGRGLADTIREGIGNLRQLKALYLNFNDCKNLTDKEFMDLSNGAIQNLEQLNTLNINFNGCDQITDQGFESLCSGGIRYLKLLEVLHLNFDGCDKITDEALKNVSVVGISSLSLIQDLQLSCLGCPKISDTSYQAFLKILEYFGYKTGGQNSKDFEDLEDNEVNWKNFNV